MDEWLKLVKVMDEQSNVLDKMLKKRHRRGSLLQSCVGTSDKQGWKALIYSRSDIWKNARCDTLMTQS